MAVTRFLSKKTLVMLKVTRGLDKDITDITALTETEIKKRTPVLTGRLKASMTARKVGFLKGEVATGVNYAPHVEFGTRRSSPRAMMRKGGSVIAKKGLRLLKKSRNVL